MKHIIFDNPFLKKKNYIVDIDIDIDQLSILQKLNEEPHDDIIKALKKKYNSYKQQDKIKNKFDDEQHITYSQMIQKIIDSQLKCYYCKCSLVILFNKKREGEQWTLERLNNNLGHYDSNTCISCLKCNLSRRTDNHEYFKQGKQLQLLKID